MQDIHARGFWEKCTSAFFDVKVCRYVHPPQPKANIQDARTRKEKSVRNQSPGNRKRNCTPPVSTTTGGMGQLKVVLEVRGLKHQFCWVYRSGFFLLIPRHETKVGRVFYMVIVIFLFLSSFNTFYHIPST